MAHKTSTGWRARLMRMAGYLPATALVALALGGTASAATTTTNQAGSQQSVLSSSFFDGLRGMHPIPAPEESSTDESSWESSESWESTETSWESDPSSFEESAPADDTGGDMGDGTQEQ